MKYKLSNILVFGDGLSDMGKYGLLTGYKYPPSPPFYGGRWTNGAVWVELLAEKLNLSLTHDNNFAMGGATTGYYNINEPLRAALGLDSQAEILGLLAQVDKALARSSQLDKETLCVVWAGGHDVGSYLEYGQPDVKQYPPINNIRAALDKLITAGARHFMVGDLPDVGATPLYAGTAKQPIATEIVTDFNTQLDQLIAEYGTKVTIVKIESVRLFYDIYTAPQTFGFTHLTDSYLPLDYVDFSQPLAENKKPIPHQDLNPDEFVSFWGLAAGSVVHQKLAERAYQALQNALK